MKKTQERFELLKAMNTIVKMLNHEGGYYEWINTIPDEADDEELLDCCEYDDIFKEACESFRDIMKQYGKDGFYLVAEHKLF